MNLNRKWVKRLSNITFFIALGLSIFLIINFFIARSRTLPGVCPLNTNRPLSYIAIGLALISFILSIIEERLKKD